MKRIFSFRVHLDEKVFSSDTEEFEYQWMQTGTQAIGRIHRGRRGDAGRVRDRK